MCGLQCAHHAVANGGNFEPNPTTSAKLGSPSPHEDENAMADARSKTTINDERVRVTTWSFEKAGDSTGAHVHEYDYVLVPITGGTLTAVSTTDGSARTITQVAGSPYAGQAGLAQRVVTDRRRTSSAGFRKAPKRQRREQRTPASDQTPAAETPRSALLAMVRYGPIRRLSPPVRRHSMLMPCHVIAQQE